MLTAIRLFLLKARIRRATKVFHSVCGEFDSPTERNRDAFELMKRNVDVAVAVLVEHACDQSQPWYYRDRIPYLLGQLGSAKAREACLGLLRDTATTSGARRNAIRAVAKMGLAGDTPFFEALCSCLEIDGFDFPREGVEALSKAGRREILEHLGPFLASAYNCYLLHEAAAALASLDPHWSETEEAMQLAPGLIGVLQNDEAPPLSPGLAHLFHERRDSKLDPSFWQCVAAQIIGVLALPQFADALRRAMHTEAASVPAVAEEALRKIAQKHNMQECLDYLAELDATRSAQKEEARRAKEERIARTEAEVTALRARIHVGMSVAQVEEVLGPHSGALAGGALLGLFGSVAGTAGAMSAAGRRKYYVWTRPEGEWKLIFEAGQLVDVYSAP
ncbi:MAG TPA: hypothetical protein VNE39_11410 [Planctomycetota bacterium]|nr:hypothetical protein [Planctomycetota bacterium]